MFKFLEKLITSWAILGGIGLLAIVAVTSANAGLFAINKLSSALFGANIAGLPGYEDFVLLVIGSVALSFLPYCQLKGQHINVTLFSNRFPPALNMVLDRLWLIVALTVAVFLTWWLCFGLLEKIEDHTITRVLGWAEWPFIVPGVISMLLWSAICLMQLFSSEAFQHLHTAEGEH